MNKMIVAFISILTIHEDIRTRQDIPLNKVSITINRNSYSLYNCTK